MGTETDISAITPLQAVLPRVFSPCATLNEAASDRPAAFDQEPAFPIATSWLPEHGPLYVTLQGPDRYCIYSVRTVQRPTHSTDVPWYGATVRFGESPRNLPVGAFLDEQGLAYAPSPRENRWYLVGDRSRLEAHFRALWQIADAGMVLYEQRLNQAPTPTSAEPTAAELAALPRYTRYNMASAQQLWRGFTEWLEWTPNGVPDLPAFLAGTTVTYDRTMAGIDAGYDPSTDAISMGIIPFNQMEKGEYDIVRSILRHETTHQQMHDHGYRSPFNALLQSGIKLLAALACPQWSGCDAGHRFTNDRTEEILRLVRQDSGQRIVSDVPSEMIGYTVQLAEAELLPTEVGETIAALYTPIREKVLRQMHTGHVPAVVFRLARDYVHAGLRTMLAQFDMADQVDRFAAAYDEHLACAEGRKSCPEIVP